MEWKKKGHFKIRGWFDLYCTHGSATTRVFKQLAEKHRYFSVKETGWPKLDPLFTTEPLDYKNDSNKTKILFAPTFSPSLTAAYELFSEIKMLSQSEEYEILVKFHPKMAQDAIEKYLSLESNTLKVCQEEGVNELLQWADIMISDTSSIVGEFSLLNKPTITLNNSQPGDYLIDIKDPNELQPALKLALEPSDELRQSIAKYAKDLHPYSDGFSANRILNATLELLKSDSKITKKKPLNLLRSYKMRKLLGYWKF
nr:CDP-glycerol glycerophosphotransferase family protein [Kangiella sp. HZ709]